MTLESIASVSDNTNLKLPVAARASRLCPPNATGHQALALCERVRPYLLIINEM